MPCNACASARSKPAGCNPRRRKTSSSTNQGGQPYIEIEPADPDVMYVPVYDPAWIWGPPLWYPYPRWYWPPRTFLTGGLYFGFGGGINVGLFFGGGWHGWGGWGWHPGWGNHTVIVNNTFIHQYNFNGGSPWRRAWNQHVVARSGASGRRALCDWESAQSVSR